LGALATNHNKAEVHGWSIGHIRWQLSWLHFWQLMLVLCVAQSCVLCLSLVFVVM